MEMVAVRVVPEHQKKPKVIPPTNVTAGNLQNGTSTDETEDEKKTREKRALCWSVVALGMSIPALIGA